MKPLLERLFLKWLRCPCAGAALVFLVACSGGTVPRGRALEISMQYSKFEPAALTVDAGATVTFTLRNDDPIAHEFILGDEAEQQRHAAGEDETHDGKPGQASLKAGETDTVVYRFDEPGTLIFGCHRPGHYAYGMRGVVTVKS